MSLAAGTGIDGLILLQRWNLPYSFFQRAHLAFQSNFKVQVKPIGDVEPLSMLSWKLGDLHSLTFSPDGKTLAAEYRQFGEVVLWGVTTHCPQHVVTVQRCHVVYLDTVPDKFYATRFPWENICIMATP